MENVYDQFFFLMYHGGWSFVESYNLPIGLRRWFIHKIRRQFELEREAIDGKVS
tara:strand:+ start:1935 stop:2096 length:162 start_codon:yes stop_codon:yes gene_type:complete